jgi:hypothetical protein
MTYAAVPNVGTNSTISAEQQALADSLLSRNVELQSSLTTMVDLELGTRPPAPS